MSANSSRLLKLLIIVCIAGGLWLLPVPAGVKPDAWHLMAIFIATVVGLILSLPFGRDGDVQPDVGRHTGVIID